MNDFNFVIVLIVKDIKDVNGKNFCLNIKKKINEKTIYYKQIRIKFKK